MLCCFYISCMPSASPTLSTSLMDDKAATLLIPADLQARAFAGPSILPHHPNNMWACAVHMSDVSFFWEAPSRWGAEVGQVRQLGRRVPWSHASFLQLHRPLRLEWEQLDSIWGVKQLHMLSSMGIILQQISSSSLQQAAYKIVFATSNACTTIAALTATEQILLCLLPASTWATLCLGNRLGIDWLPVPCLTSQPPCHASRSPGQSQPTWRSATLGVSSLTCDFPRPGVEKTLTSA